MKIAVLYNHDSKNVINLFGIPNREKYGKEAIQRIVDGLRKFKHQVKAFEADKDLIYKLEEFMPKVLKGERPGMAFNLSYGIQGQARYTHVPGILEMVGLPYVGSGPLAHALSLDKVVAKMIFIQNGLPTPKFVVFNPPNFDVPDLSYPLIVKPKNESVSMGMKIVTNEDELREATQTLFKEFNQAVLVERYIEGREINVGLIGNNPPDVLPPCEIIFGEPGVRIYTIEDKKGTSGRQIDWMCPAPIGEELTQKVQEIAQKAFSALGCYDSARVDMRLDNEGNVYILELNSLPSLGAHGSYTIAAEKAGLDFPALVNRLVEVASTRYFGTPAPPIIHPQEKDPGTLIFSFLTQRRDSMEKRLEEWTSVSSRTADPVGNRIAIKKVDNWMQEIKMKPVTRLTDYRSAWTWETKSGIKGGTLFIGHVDVPLEQAVQGQIFRRDPEWLYGEGMGVSRAPLVMLEFVLRALRHSRMLHKLPIGVLYYLDEGRDCRYSSDTISKAASEAQRVFILRPGSGENNIRVQRRGLRRYRLIIEDKPQRIGRQRKTAKLLVWFGEKLSRLSNLSSRKDRVGLAVVDIKTDSFPMFLPHRITVMLVLSYLDLKVANAVEVKMKEILGNEGISWELEKMSERPPMKDRRINQRLAKSLADVAQEWEMSLEQESSVLPSVGGLVPAKVPVVCGIGPVAKDIYTPQEAVNRASIIQRTLLMAEFLAKDITIK